MSFVTYVILRYIINYEFPLQTLLHRLEIPRVGNFIIGASGSDKQILCGSSVARAAPDYISCKQDPKRVSLSFAYNSAFMVKNFEKRRM